MYGVFFYDDVTKIIVQSFVAETIDHVTPPAGCTAVEVDLSIGGNLPPVNATYDPDDHTFTRAADPSALDTAKYDRKLYMQQRCNIAITGSFNSDALGSTHSYPASMQDQANMQRVALYGGALWVYASGTWTFEVHTAAQGETAFQDFGTNCDAARANLIVKNAAIDAAATVPDVMAIDW